MADNERLRLPDDWFPPASPNLKGSGGGGTYDDMDHRITALEKGYEKIDGKIDKLTELVNSFGLKTSERLSSIEGRLVGIERDIGTKAAKADLTSIEVKLGSVEGRISNLPTTAAMITLVLSAVGLSLGGAAGLAFMLFKLFGVAPSS